MIDLTKKEKAQMCSILADRLPEIRKMLHMSQKDFGARCGMSSNRISAIENGHFIMTWSQLISVVFLCMLNKQTKEYFFANKILPPKFFQYVQQKDENIPPEINIVANPSIAIFYEELSLLDENM